MNQLTEDKLTVCYPTDVTTYQADVLLANILLQPLKELAPHFAELIKPGGRIVLSGILSSQINDVLAIYNNYFVMNEPVIDDDWVRLDGNKVIKSAER